MMRCVGVRAQSTMLGCLSWHGHGKPLHGDVAVGVCVKTMLGAIAWHKHKALCLADRQARLDNLIACPDGSRYPGQRWL